MKQAVHRFTYGYHGDAKHNTYFDCLVTDILIDGKLAVVDVNGEQLIISPWSFTKTGEINIDLSRVDRTNIASFCADYLGMLCHK
ncbi:MAG: hypothetical protein PUD16_12050 [bacterium]|nr:hypothetical protein [bacterium]